ncbi:uncharacterized protein LOC142324803 [Lycorma delicatula]|uniref:uncharacterized protein LOC142324803 n=1 Tax=Lycorma delicatula TaxID=130591 RepID=UPI003F513A44
MTAHWFKFVDKQGVRYIQPEVPKSCRPDLVNIFFNVNERYRVDNPKTINLISNLLSDSDSDINDNISPNEIRPKILNEIIFYSGSKREIDDEDKNPDFEVGSDVSDSDGNVYKVPQAPLSSDTIYKKSYKDFDANALSNCKSAPLLPKDSLCSAGDFQPDTTHKMSYGPWEGYKRMPKIPPRDHCLLGVGPIQEMTTHRHDYVPKGIEKPNKIEHPGCLGLSNQPMEQKTTNSLSYAWPDYYEPANSFKPEKRYVPPKGKMENETVQKLSYQAWDNMKKPKYPWMEKPKYVTPSVPMQGETIYNNSYFPPGQYAEGVEGCYCNYIGECFDAEGNPPRAHEFTVCPPGYDPIRDGPRDRLPEVSS